MKAFIVQTNWENDNGVFTHKDIYSCRDLFISGLAAAMRKSCKQMFNVGPRFDNTRNIHLYLSAPTLPNTMLDTIAAPAEVQWKHQIETQKSFSDSHGYTLFGNDDTVLTAYYWLILGERLVSFYRNSFAQMMRNTCQWDWDMWGDKGCSLRLWKEYENGRIPNTFDLLIAASGPINYRRNRRWATNAN